VRVEVPRVTYVKEMVPEVLVWEKMVQALALMGAASANVSPRADGGRTNEGEPQPKDAPGRAALTLGTSKGPGLAHPGRLLWMI
jgi:hypothetical protein